MLNEDLVRGIIARWSGRSLEECLPETRMRDIGVDSLLIASIIAQIEAALATPLDDEAVARLFVAERICDIVSVVQSCHCLDS